MKCVKHPEAEATGMCVYCGKPHCADCLVEVDGKMYCKPDLTNVLKEAKQAAASAPTAPLPAINITNTNTNTNLNTNTNINGVAAYSRKSRMVALLLCLLGFLGFAGLHRFYVGKAASGIIHFFTIGVFFFGTIIDLISILSGGFRDKYGYILV